ncbi:MAG: ribosome silencing factor [Clostridia bacterium]|nr:ribosome silencing factor [Clostridia bacterium]
MEQNNETKKDLFTASPEELAAEIVNILYTKKAHNLKMLHVTDQTVIADYFIIATGNSNTQIKALANELDYKTGLANLTPKSIEGLSEASWIVLDYASVIVHIFNRETREFYNLEKLWGDSESVDVNKYIQNKDDEESNND